ncbi:MAG TPA: DUF6056 family protein [Pseudorhodoferax sp.]|jgi:hypothetical protein|nr:DUF6056 family protein [Pseudorhodoferax sp.]
MSRGLFTRLPAHWLWLGVAVLGWAMLGAVVPFGPGNDDDFFGKALRDRSLVSWLAEFYATWSGRVGIDAATVLLIPHPWLWRILNAGMLTLLLWSVAAMLRRERDARMVLFLVLAAALVSPKVWREAAWWMTGSFNYLWPTALGAFACLRFVRPEGPAWLFFLTVPAAMYACFQEQAAALLIVFQCLLGARLARDGRLRWQHAAQLAAGLAVCAVLAAAPGSAARFAAMVLHWFPEYGMLTLPERLFSGLQRALGHAFVLQHGLGLLFAALLLRVSWVRCAGWPARAAAAVPLLVLVLPAIFLHGLLASTPGVETAQWLRRFLAVGGDYQDYWIGNVANAVDVRLYLAFAVGLLAATATACSLYWIFRAEGLWPASLAVLVWLAALASSTVLGLSPTLYASSDRVFWMQDVLVLGLCAALVLRATARAGPGAAQGRFNA